MVNHHSSFKVMLGSIRRLTRLATQPYFTAAVADVALRHASKTTATCRSTPFSPPPLQFPRITTLTSAAGDQSWERKELPEELSKSVMVLTCDSSAEGGTCHVYVVGTNHISQKSCRVVQAVVSYLKPQVVFLELCEDRRPMLTRRHLPKVPTMGQWIAYLMKKKGNLFGLLLSLATVKAAQTFRVLPGSEFRVAFEEANKYNGKVVLGDRPAKITIRRAWASAFFDPEEDEEFGVLMQALWHETWEKYPTLVKTMVHERDQYMASKLLEVASTSNSVVAVVGKWHLQGMGSGICKELKSTRSSRL